MTCLFYRLRRQQPAPRLQPLGDFLADAAGGGVGGGDLAELLGVIAESCRAIAFFVSQVGIQDLTGGTPPSPRNHVA